MDEDTSYFVIPSNVLYNRDIMMGARILYIEILAACRQQGYCDKSNEAFAETFRVSRGTIIRWVANLKANDLVAVERVYRKGGHGFERILLIDEILERREQDGNGSTGEHPDI